MSATLAKGVGFYVSNSGFQKILNITTYTESGISWKTEDVTSHDDAVPCESIVPTIRNDGKISLVISPYLPLDTQHAFLRTISQSNAANVFRITYPGGTQGSFDVNAYVTNFTFDTSVNGVYKAKLDLMISGSVVDDAAKLVTVAVTDSEAGAYVTGETMTMKATFDEIVNVTGTPRISVVLTSGTVFANYASGTGTNVLTFSKTFGGGDAAAATHVSISSPIGLNSGTINDVFGNAAVLTFTAPTTSGFTVN